MTQILTTIATTIIAAVAVPIFAAGMVVCKIGALIMIPAKVLADFGVKLVEEQRMRERAAKRDDSINNNIL